MSTEHLAKMMAQEMITDISKELEKQINDFRHKGFINQCKRAIELVCDVFFQNKTDFRQEGVGTSILRSKMEEKLLEWVESPETSKLINDTFKAEYELAVIELSKHAARGKAAKDVKKNLTV